MRPCGSPVAGGTPDYPPLDDNSRASKKVAEVEHEIREATHKVRQALEVVASDHAAWVLIGMPPKKLGGAWIHDAKVSGLIALIAALQQV